MAEQAPFKRLVVGSSPTRLTIPNPNAREASARWITTTTSSSCGAASSRPGRAAPTGRTSGRAEGPSRSRWPTCSGRAAGSCRWTAMPARCVSRPPRWRRASRRPGSARSSADFTGDLAGHDLPPLDGIVMANSLHFQADHVPVVRRVATLLRPGGRFVLVEYDADRGNPWVPHPLSFETWRRVAGDAGLTEPRLIGRVPSRFLGAIYSAVAERPATAADPRIDRTPRRARPSDRCRCRPARRCAAGVPAAPRRARARRRPARSKPGPRSGVRRTDVSSRPQAGPREGAPPPSPRSSPRAHSPPRPAPPRPVRAPRARGRGWTP